MRSVTREDVLHCAELAALELGESEIEPLRRDMEQLLSFAGRLGSLSAPVDMRGSDGNVPDTHPIEPPLRRREDAALPGLSQEEALMNAAVRDRGCFAVQKIL
jgi:aspartyl/glutamyl-tRNA(Asn/Gln) amidotransferase C subunit